MPCRLNRSICSPAAQALRPNHGGAMVALACMACVLAVGSARAVDSSQPALLQMFEARWDTIEDRMADIFQVGYGQMWLPPPGRGGSGVSVGYDVFDRFDLGAPRHETQYGTETSLKASIAAAHRASVSIYTDFIHNHNGFADQLDAGFVANGGYPGFAMSTPGDQYGDFHDPFINFDADPVRGQLGNLIDIAQEKNHQFIRHPIEAGPNAIPAGAVYNKPNPNNARFYPDRDAPGLSLNDPELSTITTRYSFNAASPLSGDPVTENATGLLMRDAQWMVEVIGVDGFRVDAAKHAPEWVLDYIDQAVFRANPRMNHDGTFKPVFMFSEVFEGNKAAIQPFIRKDLPNSYAISPNNTTVGGNRDALDFPLFFALRQNLSGNGLQNNWHGIRNASLDTQDDGLRNGSQGVSFVDSHDNIPGGFPFLKNVAYAYTLMRPGNALVYLNADEFQRNDAFPNDGRGDALGGLYGETISTLVELRNTHGRGNFQERWVDDAFNPNGFSNVYVYERENSALVALNSRLDAGFDERTVQTGFAPGTVLVELTGNATNVTLDPSNDIRDTVRVNASGQATIRIPRNSTHGMGYVVYGVAPPQGTLSLTNVSQTLEGATPTQTNNGTSRLADIDVITANSFKATLNTTPVTLPAPPGESSPVRDFEADGDQAFLRLDGGMNLNNVFGIDRTNPADVSYAFEDFTDARTPGYISDGLGGNTGTGSGLYEQTIDATQLSEGRHYLNVRAYRRRGTAGTPVFTDFKKTIYIDRLKPEAALVSFDPFASNPSATQNRDLIVRSTDGTADSMAIFLDLAPNVSEAQILQMVQSGQGGAGAYDRDSFIKGFFNVGTGNHVATVVTFEPTGNTNVQRFPGLFTDTSIGVGFGDMNGSGTVTTNEIMGSGALAFNQLLYSQGNAFHAAADVDGDGVITNLDLFQLGDELVANGASAAVMSSYDQLLVKRGDVNEDGVTDGADAAALYASIGATNNWLKDLNVDGAVSLADVQTLVSQLVRTSYADFNLDRRVDGADFLIWQRNQGAAGARFDQGDAGLNASIGADDLAIWQSAFGTTAPIAAAAVPEPSAALLAQLSCILAAWRRYKKGAHHSPFTFRKDAAAWPWHQRGRIAR
jgi:glycosidase